MIFGPDQPFSGRYRGNDPLVANDFPATARIGLIHLLEELVEGEYTGGWIVVARELLRIGREDPVHFDVNRTTDLAKAWETSHNLVRSLPWLSVCDFIERIYSHLSSDKFEWDDRERFMTRSRDDAKLYISAQLQRLFMEEHLALEFKEGLVLRRGRSHTADQTRQAESALSDTRLALARVHYGKALRFFRSPTSPDPENAVKEAVCARH
jgi:hypothetical protein